MNNALKVFGVGCLVVVLFMVAIVGLILFIFPDKEELGDTENLGNIYIPGNDSTYFVIYKEIYWEYTPAVYYEVVVNQDTVSSMCYFTAGRDITKEYFLATQYGDIGVLTWKNDPHSILAMYDFSTKESYPNRGFSESYDELRVRADRMLEKVQVYNGKLKFSK